MCVYICFHVIICIVYFELLFLWRISGVKNESQTVYIRVHMSFPFKSFSSFIYVMFFFINFLRLVFLLFTFQMSFGSVHIGQQIMRHYEKEKINCCFMEIIPMAYIVIEE